MTGSSNINIKLLPATEEVIAGDFFIVENSFGTQLLDYKHLVISEDNITFSPKLTGFTSDINTALTVVNNVSSSTTKLSAMWTEYIVGDEYKLYSLSSVGIGTSNLLETLTIGGNVSAQGTLSAGGYNIPGPTVAGDNLSPDADTGGTGTGQTANVVLCAAAGVMEFKGGVFTALL